MITYNYQTNQKNNKKHIKRKHIAGIAADKTSDHIKSIRTKKNYFCCCKNRKVAAPVATKITCAQLNMHFESKNVSLNFS